MRSLLSSVEMRIAAGLVATLVFLIVRYGFDFWRFLTGRDFVNVNVYMVVFTRHDRESKSDRVIFDLMGYKIPLRDICRNIYLFWYILWRITRTTSEQPVLSFNRDRDVLAPVRGRVSQSWTSMALKRAAGMSFAEVPCQLALVYSRSERSQNSALRVMLIQDRDVRCFDEYLQKRPKNSQNFEFVAQIVEAHRAKTGSFIDVRVTVA